MENRKYVIIISFILVSLLPNVSFAYSRDTHALLTESIFDEYSQNNSKLNKDLKDYLIDGSIKEDDPPRWMNHFYDPINDRGLNQKGIQWNKSKDWVLSDSLQNQKEYQVPSMIASVLSAVQQKKIEEISAKTNYTWNEAIRYYVKNEPEKSMFALGHVLHVLEDMAVPDHTRNDPHPEGSPYEKSIKTLSPEVAEVAIVPKFNSLAEYYKGLSLFSNENFYSKDTVGKEFYSNPEPEIFENKGRYRLAIGDLGNSHVLYKEPKASSILIKTSPEIIFENDVWLSYWSHLAPQAVGYGVGVMDLFFQEVEKAKQDPNFSLREDKTFLAMAVDTFKDSVVLVKNRLALLRNRFSSKQETEVTQNENITENKEVVSEEEEEIVYLIEEEIVEDPETIIYIVEETKAVASTSSMKKVASTTREEEKDEIEEEDFPKTTFANASTNPIPNPVVSIDPIPLAKPIILISEILPNASGTDVGKEFIELYNPSEVDIDISSWSMRLKTEDAENDSSLISFGKEPILIKAKSFYLIGLNKYEGLIEADESRSASLPNKPTTIRLLDPDKVVVDEVSYREVEEGSSLERKALVSGNCIEAILENEFTGNACDTGISEDFSLRLSPKPQNSRNLKEPREKPAPVASIVSEFDKNEMNLRLSWNYSTSSNVGFKIILSSTSTYKTSVNEIDIPIQEVGSTYEIKVYAEDAEGLVSEASVTSINIPSFIDRAQILKVNEEYFVDIFYSQRPFIPALFERNFWQGLVLYRNSVPNLKNDLLTTANRHSPEDASSVIRVDTKQQYSAIFGLTPEQSPGIGDGLYNSSFLLPEEDGRLRLKIITEEELDLEKDYFTIAFYDFYHSGGGTQDLKLVAVDKNHYGKALSGMPPKAPDVSTSFEALSKKLTLSWPDSDDVDSSNEAIKYEYFAVVEGEEELWESIGLENRIEVSVVYGNKYRLGAKAIDPEGNTSQIWSSGWEFPADYVDYALSNNIGYASQTFIIDSTSTLKSINLFTADMGTQARNPDAVPCELSLFRISGGENVLIEKSESSYMGLACGGELSFKFSNMELGAGEYKWVYSISTGNPSTSAWVKFYGTANDSVSGIFSGSGIADARFKLIGENGIIFSN